MGKQIILSIKQLLVLVVVVVVVQLIKKEGNQQMKIVVVVVLLLLFVCQLEVIKEDITLVAARGDGDSLDLIHGEHICVH